MKAKHIILFIFLILILMFSLYEMLYTLDNHRGLILLILFGGMTIADVVAISSLYFRLLKNHSQNK